MKLKGINPIEQHVEKIVLAVVCLVFVGVLTVQFLFAPNEVDYDGQSVPPDQVLERLGTKAKATLAAMNDPNPALPEVDTPDLLARYEKTLSGAAFEAPRLASASLGDRFELTVSEVETLDGPVTPLRLPFPEQTMAVSQWITVDPFFADATPSMRRYLPEVQPMDKVSVTVEAKVNGELIREALESADEGRRPIPSHWWSEAGEGLIEVLTVTAERQRQNPDGSWGPTEPVEQVRWTPTVLEAFNEGMPDGETVGWDGLRTADLLNLSRLAKDDPSLVSQPIFVPSIAGVEWVPPSKVADRQARLEIEAEIGRIEREIADLNQEIASIEQRMQSQRNQPQQPSARQPSGGGGLIIGGGGGGTGGRGTRANRPDPMQQRIDSKRDEIAERQTQLDDLFTKMQDLGGQAGTQQTALRRQPTQPTGMPGGTGPRILGGGQPQPRILGGDPGTGGRSVGSPRSRGSVTRQSAVESPGPLLSLDDYSVWVHDFTAEPGAVYRYRVRYGVNNPLYKRSVGSEEPEMVAVAEQPIVESDWSNWTEPVSVGRTSYFFVTNARDQGQMGQTASAATAEIFRMFYGYYRKHTLTLEPGDAVQGEFRLPDDLPLFDVDGVTEEDLMAYFAEREAKADPMAAMPQTGVQPGGTGGRILGGPTTPQAAPQDDEEPVERDWLTLVEPRYPLAVDAVMLDVAEYPIVEASSLEGLVRARRVFEVLFFDPISGVVSRRPDRDREMGEYAAVQQSAGLAESATIRRPDPEYVP
jgi:hypothetical protein